MAPMQAVADHEKEKSHTSRVATLFLNINNLDHYFIVPNHLIQIQVCIDQINRNAADIPSLSVLDIPCFSATELHRLTDAFTFLIIWIALFSETRK